MKKSQAAKSKSTLGRSLWKWSRRIVFGLLAAVAVGLFTAPYWLGGAIRAFAPSDLLSFDSYETVGYGRFSLKGVTINAPSAKVSIDELEALSPLNWLYRSWREDREAMAVVVGKVELEILETGSEKTTKPGNAPKNLPEVFELVESILGQVHPYLESLSVEEAKLTQGSRSLVVSKALWQNGQLSFSAVANERPEDLVTFELDLGSDVFDLEMRLPSQSINLQAKAEKGTDEVLFKVGGRWLNNVLGFNASFGRSSWLPSTANWQASNWEILSGELGLQGPYSNYRFDLEGTWDGQGFDNRFEGRASGADGVEGEAALPDVDLVSSVHGDLESARLDSFAIRAPGLSASISDPISVDFVNRTLEGKARFDIDFDLSILKLPELEGLLRGTFEFSSSEAIGPSGTFRFSGTDIKAYSFLVDELLVDADLNWPNLEINKFDARFSNASNVSGSADLDLASKLTRSATVRGRLESGWLSRFLPEDVDLGVVSFDLKAEGPWVETVHSGSLEFEDLEKAPLRKLDGSASWSGVVSRVDALAILVKSDSGSLDITGSAEYKEGELISRIETLNIARGGEAFAQLLNPVDVRVLSGANPVLRLSEILLRGPEGEVALEASLNGLSSGVVALGVSDLNVEPWLDPWLVKTTMPELIIHSVDTELSWEDGPLVGRLSYALSSVIAKQEARSEGSVRLGKGQAILEAVSVSDLEGTLFSMSGEFPVDIYVSDRERPLHIDRDAKLALNLKSGHSEKLNTMLSKLIKMDIGTFATALDVSGSLSNPNGSVRLAMRTKEIEGEFARPPISIDANGLFEGNRVSFERVTLGYSTESFSTQAVVELPVSFADLVEGTSDVDWAKTYVSVSTDNSSLSPLVYFAPQTLNTGGTLSAKIEGSPVGGFDGHIIVKNLNTRSIFPFGALREVRAEIEFSEQRATLKEFSGKVGREPVLIEGWFDYEKLDEIGYKFAVTGSELPLVRRVGLLLRTDLDLVIEKKRSEQTQVQGTVALKDGLFLLNMAALLEEGGTGGRSAASRPPYFSVEAPLFADWKLDVALVGQEFMRVHTPAAKGVLSTKMKLAGTLNEPFVTGETLFEKGELLFPFAAFRIDKGSVEIRIDDPYTPLLDVVGTTRRFGYDLEVSISGSAFDPLVRFNSSPPLSSEQVLLMVMAGENPAGIFDYSTTQRASKLGSYLSKGIFSSGGGSGIGSRFSLSSGENLSRQGKETLEMELRLDDRFQLVGEYDEYDAWNGGIRWRIRDPRREKEEGENGK